MLHHRNNGHKSAIILMQYFNDKCNNYIQLHTLGLYVNYSISVD